MKPKDLHPDYISIQEELLNIPASLDDEDIATIALQILVCRLLWGMNWTDKYVKSNKRTK